jgi:hypothetical protein
MAYTTTNLLTSIELKSFSPANQTTFESTEILSMTDDIIKGDIVPAIVETREDYFVTYKDYTITASQAAYDIPARASGMAVREVHILNAAGDVIRNPQRIRPEEIGDGGTGTPYCFYFRGNQIVLYPTPNTTENTLRVYYFIERGALVSITSAAVISDINTSTNVVTVTTIPSTWITGDTFDFIRKDGAHEYRGIDYVSTLVSGTALTFSSLPTNLAVGDYVNQAGESAVVQLPPNFRPALATLVAAEILLNTSQPGGEERFKRGMELLEKAKRVIAPRAEGELEIIMPDWS